MRWFLGLAALALVACGQTSTSQVGARESQPSATTTAIAPAATPSPTPELLAKRTIEGVARNLYRGNYPTGCQLADRPSLCPVSDLLAMRMVAWGKLMQAPGPPDLFCRCQNPSSQSLTVTGEPISANQGVAHVVLFGDTKIPINLDWLIVKDLNGSVLAHDQWCTGKDQKVTSLFADKLTACGPEGGVFNP